ncbi:hypothetical protein Q4512_00650 [Oceanihabitans sp. 2_MG-2023]|uniref:hypothetical protein n=1 Tax=Oceanihabitans sp. 2_MG-2023 TaxID=3062661 RepID=UPI0026E467AF|nr:hypothetical protein [Oceanihabitans sp. 2_MG-2023]MDO6595399.1 hypothetical protein [Oceanihabitans sp. 2_MG-2023]
MKKTLVLAIALVINFAGFSQEEDQNEGSNIQTYTPSKLLKKGQWDIKFFNSLYTQTKTTGDGTGKSFDIDRQNFFTNTTEVYTGISKNSRINVGLIIQVRANNYGGQDAFSVFDFENNGIDSRSGLTTIAPSIRVQPFASVPNFSFTSSVYFAVFEDKDVPAYLDKRSTFWETKFFYDKTFGGGDWQIFTEADFGFNFGETTTDALESGDAVNVGERFANNSLFLPVSAFLSYFPSSKSTLFVNAQQAFLMDLGNEFEQNYTQLGFGGKYQLTQALNIEASYGKIVRGNNFQGLGSTFSLGLRALL